MNAGYAHEIRVGMDAADGLDRRRANGNDGVLEQLATDQDHFYISILEQLQGYGWAVGDDGGFEVVWDVPGDLSGGGAAVEDYDLAWLNHLCCCAADGYFPFGSDVLALGEICDSRGGGEGSAVNALKEAFVGHLAEIAADGVFGDAHGLAYFFCDDLALSLEDGEDLLFSVGG